MGKYHLNGGLGLLIGLLIGLLMAALPSVAAAHSFGERYAPPMPVSLYQGGALLALGLSFLLLLWRAPKAYGFEAVLSPPQPALIGQCVAVLLLILTITSGYFGSQNPYRNFSMTFFWIWLCVILPYASVLLGRVYVSPWAALFRYVPNLDLPYRWQAWPAFALFMGLIVLELFGQLSPKALALWLLAYTALNGLMAWCFGTVWFEKGELFAVWLSFFARLAWRSPRWRLAHASQTLLVLAMLSVTAFDALQDTERWRVWLWVDLYQPLKPLVGDNPFIAFATLRPWFLALEILALLLSPFVYALIWRGALWLSARWGRITEPSYGHGLLVSLLPLIVAYHVAHYAGLAWAQGTQIVRMLSNPLGLDQDFFGTADWLAIPLSIPMDVLWHGQVLVIVLGHVISIVMAHRIAHAYAVGRRLLFSQLPMIVLMLLYTVLGLWLLAEPLKQSGF